MATTTQNDHGVAGYGDSRQQPHTDTQHRVTHEVLAGAELVRGRNTFEVMDMLSQTTESKLIRHSGKGKTVI